MSVRAPNAVARVGVLVFPGTNSEEETKRACDAVGLRTDLVHWKTPLQDVRRYDALILPGGFAYEDRVRAGAIAAHDALMDAVCEAASGHKPVLGICNGAQILMEAGLVPGFETAHPQAGFAVNAPGGRFLARHVYVKLDTPPRRCVFTAHMARGALIPAWHANREGRLSASPSIVRRIVEGEHGTFVYANERGETTQDAIPNGSLLGIAGLTNVEGNVLAVMPHPERDAWTFMHPRGSERERARGNGGNMLAPSGGIALFEGLAAALS